jgi:curved DNA-binding protein CbpA
MSNAIVISPAAKALDYFQEALALLGIADDELAVTPERLKAAYKRASLRAHPDKGGSKEDFDAVNKAYRYVERILARVSPQFAAESDPRLKAAVTPKAAEQYRADPTLKKLETSAPPVQLSAKKLDMSMFNRLFEENRLPDPDRDGGYGDWLKSSEAGLEHTDPRARTDVSTKNFESAMRQYATKNPGAITRHAVPQSLVQTTGVTELGGQTGNFTSAMDSGTQFTDLKEAYSSGATFFQEVAHVHVDESRRVNPKAAERERAEAMARADPEEKARIQTAMDAEAQREMLRRLRLAKQDTAGEAWNDAVRRRLLVNNG